jgi:non-ribosomal peptide synthetase component E (peptide arylation enzyme)
MSLKDEILKPITNVVRNLPKPVRILIAIFVLLCIIAIPILSLLKKSSETNVNNKVNGYQNVIQTTVNGNNNSYNGEDEK